MKATGGPRWHRLRAPHPLVLDVMIPGIVGDSLHIRGLLDKLGVKPDFITEGAYKSAAELFMREQPSPQADEMMNWLIDSSFASLKESIAQGRKTDPAKVQAWIDNGLFSAEAAKSAGLIDAAKVPLIPANG